jgi:enamine deaminase RidA (YjgF/YER057c/UK114 family)
VDNSSNVNLDCATADDNEIQRWPARSAVRSRAVRWQGLLWIVASAPDSGEGIDAQIAHCLRSLDASLADGGTDKTQLLSVQVVLADMSHKPLLDEAWNAWIGPDLKNWPQRSCIGAALAPGLLVEFIALAIVK